MNLRLRYRIVFGIIFILFLLRRHFVRRAALRCCFCTVYLLNSSCFWTCTYTLSRTHTQTARKWCLHVFTRFMLSFLLFWPYKCKHTHTATHTLTGEWDHTVKAFAFFWFFDSNYIVVPVLVALSQQFLAGAYVSVFAFAFAFVCVCTWC